MRLVVWTDRHGMDHASFVRDNDPDDMAEFGVPMLPPDLDLINWEEVKQELHNELVRRKLFTWRDVQREQRGVTQAIQVVLKRRLILLYRMQEVTNE